MDYVNLNLPYHYPLEDEYQFLTKYTISRNRLNWFKIVLLVMSSFASPILGIFVAFLIYSI